MDTALAQLHDRLSTLEQENTLLGLRLQSCEQGSVQFSVSNFSEHRLLEATAQVANALLTIAPFNQAVNTALQIIGEALDTDRVNVIENFDHPSDLSFPYWRVLYEWDSPGTVPQFSDPGAAEGSYEEVQWLYERLQQGKASSYLIEDAPEPFRSAQIAIGVKSTHIVPISVEGQWWGVLGLDDCREAKQRSAAELAVLQIAADCIGSAIQRNRTQQALLQAEQARSQALEQHNIELQQALDRLAESEQRYRQLMELTSEGIFRAEYEEPISITLPVEEQVRQIYQYFRLAEHNLAYAEMFGYDQPNALIGTRLPEVHIPDAPENAVQMEQFVCNGHQMRNQETVEVDRFGRKRHFLNNGFSIIQDGYAIGAWATQIDITELRETQQALLEAEQNRAAELAKANEALARASERLAEQPDLSAFLSHIALEAIAQLGADAAMLSILDQQHQVLRAVAHVEQGRIPVSTLAVEMPVHEAAFVDVLLETRKPQYFDLEQEAHLFWQGAIDYHHQRQHQAVMAVPLFAGGNFLGHLGLAFTHNDPIREQRSELLYALAQQAALAIQLTQLAEEAKQAAIAREQEKAAQERAAELAKANEALRRGVERLAEVGNINALLDSFLLEAMTVTGASAGAVFNRVAGTEFQMRSLAQDGSLLDPADTAAFGSVLQAVSARDPVGVFRQIIKVQVYCHDIDDYYASWFPEAAAFHRQQGNQVTWNFPFRVGGEVVGFLGLAFREYRLPNQVVSETVQALGYQVSLALETLRLAEEAKQVAIFEERNRMASEIHDTLAQAFTGISLQLEVAKSLVEEDPQAVQQILNHISQLAEAGLTEARRSVWALYPPAAEYADLAQLLYDSVEQMTRSTAISVEVNVQGEPCCLPPFIGMNLLRIGQEALTNALKHAQAETITIELAYEHDRILLTIRDNGRGFTPPDTIDNLNGGFGLMGMSERCDRIAAQLSLTSQPGQGTQILVEAPLG